MTDYEIYVFLLCLIVFVMLTALSTACITIITRLSLRLIRSGLDDERIVKEHHKRQKAKQKMKYIKVADIALTTVICLLFLAMFAGSLIIQCTESSACGFLPSYRVVRTGSMAEVHEKNDYLWENGLTDQIQVFDLIRTEQLPDEMELELYDIVVYEVDGMQIVHRIVEIEEPNERHPDCRHFRLQGDAVEAADRFPVLYEQMLAIYRGDRTPFIGSFILFMQSFAGWLCIFLILVAIIVTPMLEKVIRKAENERLSLCLGEPEEKALNATAEGDTQ